jgi:hypothetical protein
VSNEFNEGDDLQEIEERLSGEGINENGEESLEEFLDQEEIHIEDLKNSLKSYDVKIKLISNGTNALLVLGLLGFAILEPTVGKQLQELDLSTIDIALFGGIVTLYLGAFMADLIQIDLKEDKANVEKRIKKYVLSKYGKKQELIVEGENDVEVELSDSEKSLEELLYRYNYELITGSFRSSLLGVNAFIVSRVGLNFLSWFMGYGPGESLQNARYGSIIVALSIPLIQKAYEWDLRNKIRSKSEQIKNELRLKQLEDGVTDENVNINDRKKRFQNYFEG